MVSDRIVSVKRIHGKKKIGVLVFVDEEVLNLLEDLADFYGDPDLGFEKAIRLLHANIFGGESPVLDSRDRIEELMKRLERKIAEIASSVGSRPIPSRVPESSRIKTLDLEPLEAVEESPEEEELSLDDLIDSVAVVEVDEELFTETKKKEKDEK